MLDYLADLFGTSRPGGGFTLQNPLGSQSIFTFLQNLINSLSGIAVFVGVLVIIYGGFLLLLGGGNPKMIEQGKKTILYAVIGVAVVLVAGVIISLVKEILGVQ